MGPIKPGGGCHETKGGFHEASGPVTGKFYDKNDNSADDNFYSSFFYSLLHKCRQHTPPSR